MKISTFCVLLISVLMLAAAGIYGLTNEADDSGVEAASSAARDESETDEAMIALQGAVKRECGAFFSDSLGQWSYREDIVIKTSVLSKVRAACELTIISIDRAEGGSCITAEGGDLLISVWPVKGVRAFVGSRIKCGDAFAQTASEELYIDAARGGKAVNPKLFIEIKDISEEWA